MFEGCFHHPDVTLNLFSTLVSLALIVERHSFVKVAMLVLVFSHLELSLVNFRALSLSSGLVDSSS